MFFDFSDPRSETHVAPEQHGCKGYMKGHTACALACHSEPSDAAGFELLLLAEILVERRGNGLHSGVHATPKKSGPAYLTTDMRSCFSSQKGNKLTPDHHATVVRVVRPRRRFKGRRSIRRSAVRRAELRSRTSKGLSASFSSFSLELNFGRGSEQDSKRATRNASLAKVLLLNRNLFP